MTELSSDRFQSIELEAKEGFSQCVRYPHYLLIDGQIIVKVTETGQASGDQVRKALYFLSHARGDILWLCEEIKRLTSLLSMHSNR